MDIVRYSVVGGVGIVGDGVVDCCGKFDDCVRDSVVVNIKIDILDYSFSVVVDGYLFSVGDGELLLFSIYPSVHTAVFIYDDNDIVDYLLAESLFGSKKLLYALMWNGCLGGRDYFSSLFRNDFDVRMALLFCNYIIDFN